MKDLKLADLLSLSRLVRANPVGDAASLGSELGNNFSRFLSNFSFRREMSDRSSPISILLSLGLGKSDLKIPQEIINEFQKNNNIDPNIDKLQNLKPFEVVTHRGYRFDVFIGSDYSKQVKGLRQGQISDPYSGETFYFNNIDEFAIALKKLEESRRNFIRDRVRAELLLASGGGPDAIERIYKSTAPIKDGEPAINLSYKEKMQEAVADAVLGSASSMSLAELKRFAAKYPGLNLLIQQREAEAKKLNVSLAEAEHMTKHDFNLIEKDQERIREAFNWYRTVQLA